MIENIDGLLKIIGVIVAILGLWFKDYLGAKLGLKKDEKDIENSSLNNIEKRFDIYESLVDDIDRRYKARIVEIELDIERLKTINEELKSIIDEQKTIINKQNKSLTYFRNRYGEEEINK